MTESDRSAGIPDDRAADDTFLAGAGDMGALVRSVDWRVTPLSVESSPASATTFTVSLPRRPS